jgi:TfoX/Sxy family transcriptional regulator of competence genes
MAYDEELAERVRELVADEPGLAEKKMFGGVAFLLHGNMAVGASGQGGLLIRVDPAEGDELIASTAAEPMEMQGRAMSGWLRVDTDALRTDEDLTSWVGRGTAYARTLPPKKS